VKAGRQIVCWIYSVVSVKNESPDYWYSHSQHIDQSVSKKQPFIPNKENKLKKGTCLGIFPTPARSELFRIVLGSVGILPRKRPIVGSGGDRRWISLRRFRWESYGMQGVTA
jgi:hypothetical protein